MDWLFREPIVIGPTSGLSGFPVYINLADLSPHFFQHVKTTGADIRVYQSDSITQCPFELVSISTTNKTGELWFKGDLSASSTTFYIWYGSPTATAYAATDTYGSQNVWTNFNNAYHLRGNVNDSSSAANNASLIDTTQATDSVQFLGEQLIGGNITGSTGIPFGQATLGNQQIAQSFTISSSLAGQMDFLLQKQTTTGALATTSQWGVQADVAGSPSGANIANGTFALNGTGNPPVGTDVIMISNGGALTGLVPGTTYWLVLSMGVTSDTNYPAVAYDPTAAYGALKSFDGASWNLVAGSMRIGVYKSGYMQIATQINLGKQNMGASFVLKKVDTNYEAVLANAVSSNSGHFQINGIPGDFVPEPGRVNYRPSAGNNVNGGPIASMNTADGLYHWYALVRDTNSTSVYIDGALVSTMGTDSSGNDLFRNIGAIQTRLNSTYGQPLTGNMKDLFFTTAAVFTPGYVAALGINGSSPGTFYSVLAPQTINGWSLVLKPSDTTWTNVFFSGHQIYDDPNVLYDDPNVFYDSIDSASWTNVPKPSDGLISVPGMATGLIMPPTYASREIDTPAWTKVPKPN